MPESITPILGIFGLIFEINVFFKSFDGEDTVMNAWTQQSNWMHAILKCFIITELFAATYGTT